MDADQIHKIEELVGRLPNDEERRERKTIYRVPAHIRESCKNYYEPRVVSIGPYHHGRPHLEAMEKLKRRYLAGFLSRSGRSMKDYINALTPVEPEARRCYFESIGLTKEDFVAVLLLDGCFIIELLSRSRADAEINNSLLPEWIKALVKTDLLMLENQIPYTVLKRLYDTYLKPAEGADPGSGLSSSNVPQDCSGLSLNSLILSFFFEERTMAEDPTFGENIHHLLHFYHHYFVPHIEYSREPEVVRPVEERPFLNWNDFAVMERIGPSLVPGILLLSTEEPINQEESIIDKFIRNGIMYAPSLIILSVLELILKLIFYKVMAVFIRFILFGSFVHIDKTTPGRIIRCATQLKDSGVSIRQKREPTSFLDVSFRYRYLIIPRTVIDKATRSNYMNLVAFEQCSDRMNKDLTGYAVFMNSLISDAKDVVILQREGIIENKLPDDEQVVLFFNDLRECAYNYDSKYLLVITTGIKAAAN